MFRIDRLLYMAEIMLVGPLYLFRKPTPEYTKADHILALSRFILMFDLTPIF